ncbi:hypothetical protein Hydth_1656 [Hydrogenobacter thermophilus TK-6]|uniref:Uncharacterized protein n=1 Tax=Hydrogenobacter thermophilus (strain DSM 6534 / IAM 12695 / TK-6) TaxID=608538 RepID=D3DJW6_HYDTT|nr:hypothetical protein Hydth_1656 [Hydrogenobacter thermophilus TK-6]BAI70118.1 hypothetical protein HTH_1671 [Hydrogenobacter thermophilus TK-6]
MVISLNTILNTLSEKLSMIKHLLKALSEKAIANSITIQQGEQSYVLPPFTYSHSL